MTAIYEIDLYSFSANSADLFRTALRDYFNSGSTKMILDLRGNPGGYLEAAVDMASYFLPVGETVVSEDFKGKQPAIVHRSVGMMSSIIKNFRWRSSWTKAPPRLRRFSAGALSAAWRCKAWWDALIRQRARCSS
jgi:hypothetical protein